MPHNCRHCGAPLPIQEYQRFATCKYCKTVNQLAPEQKSPFPLHSSQHQAQFQQPQIHIAPEQLVHAAKPGLIIAAAISLVVTGIVTAVMLGAGASTSNLSSGNVGKVKVGAVTKNLQWGNSSSSCFVDKNGDGVLDIVGLMGEPGATNRPTVVDGSTGKVLWEGEVSWTKDGSPKDVRMVCANKDYFLVDSPSFRAGVYHMKSLDKPKIVDLKDRLQAVGRGEGCVTLRTQDGSQLGLKLPDNGLINVGGADNCKGAGKMRSIYESAGTIGLTTPSIEISEGQNTYKLQKRSQGTKVLSVTKSVGGKQAWSVETNHAAPTFTGGMAIAPKQIVLFAAQISDTSKGQLVGLDQGSGRELFVTPLAGMVTNNVKEFGYNGQHIIVAFWTGLRAHDPATGKEVWRQGS